jgi:hypothetical protein
MVVQDVDPAILAANPGATLAAATGIWHDYMLLPALALLAAVTRAPLRWAWLAIDVAFLVGMAVRWQVWLDGMTWLHHYYKYIHYAGWCRFDALLAGVALALLRNGHPTAWIRVIRHGNYLLAAGGAATAMAVALFLLDHYGLGVIVFGFPLLALGVSLLILAALAPGSLLHRMRVPGAASLAL